MRFIHVIFLALWQLTAIPFIALISANSINAWVPRGLVAMLM